MHPEFFASVHNGLCNGHLSQMKTTPECIACFMKQALLATQRMTDDPEEASNALKRAAELIP
jgi:hypothetical protein